MTLITRYVSELCRKLLIKEIQQLFEVNNKTFTLQ